MAVSEIENMKKLSGHPNILELRDALEDDHYLYLIFDLCQGGDVLGEAFYAWCGLSDCM